MEQASQSLHAAEVFLVELLPDEELPALIPKVVARAGTVLERDDPRRWDIDRLPTMPPGAARRAALARGMEVAYDASDQAHVRVRDFRNVLFVSAVLIAVLMGLLVVIVAAHPTAMPLCFRPSQTAPSTVAAPNGSAGAAVGQPDEAPATTVCPSGDRQRPSSGDVMIVAGLGLLGGALAAAFTIRKLRGTSTPYDIPLALAMLKVPSGSLTAVAAILLLGGGFVPGLSQLDSQRQILAYALVFGYAQQLATRFIDDRAQSILNSLPSTDPDAKQPTPATPPAPVPPGSPVAPQAPQTTPPATEEQAPVSTAEPATAASGRGRKREGRRP